MTTELVGSGGRVVKADVRIIGFPHLAPAQFAAGRRVRRGPLLGPDGGELRETPEEVRGPGERLRCYARNLNRRL